MKETNIYLTFDGNCREAMTFYGSCFHSEPDFTPFSAGPPEMGAAVTGAPDRILHAEMRNDGVLLMASDTMPGKEFRQGNNFSISIACESQAELERLFGELGKGGAVTMALHEAFWGGKFGMVADQFGVSWMLSFRAPGQHT